MMNSELDFSNTALRRDHPACVLLIDRRVEAHYELLVGDPGLGIIDLLPK